MDRIWTFKTKALEVFCEWEPEQGEDLSWADAETLENLAQGIYVNATWHVGVLVNGELYADEYLGNSVYENLESFRTEHFGISPLTRERLDTAICGGYFIDMVRQCLADTRRKLTREAEGRERARAWLDAYQDAEYHHQCKHGHLQCSTVPDGRCLDETLQCYPELSDTFDGDMALSPVVREG